MTKRISQANTVVVPTAVKVAEGQAAAAKAVVVPGEVEAAAKADVAEKGAPTTTVEPVAALVAPAPLAMVAAQDTTTTTTGTDTTASTTSAQSTGDVEGTDYTPYIVGGVLLAGGILAVALSSDDDNGTSAPAPTPAPTNAVTFSSAATASVAENSAATTLVLDVNAAAATTGGAIVYTLGGTDAAAFNINASTGEVRFNASPNFEAKSSYSITVTGSSAANGTTPAATASQTITVTVTNVNEAPTFASATATATAINENSAITTPVFTAAATDPDGTVAPNTLTYSLGTAGDSALFTINAATGAVSLRAPADFETKASYTFAVTATDQAGLSATQTVTLNVNNVNEAPTFGTATTRAVSYAENGTAALFAAGGATDPDGTAAPNTLTYTLTGADQALFQVNATTGAVSFRASPDFETPRSAANSNVYSFNLVATDQGGLSATQANTITVTDVNEGPAPVTINLDGGTNPFSGLGVGGAAQATTFVDGPAASTSVINNFGRDDVVRFAQGAAVSFSSIDNDLLIQFTVNGVVSDITINDIVSPNAIITSEASAEAAVNAFFGTTGGDYFRFG